MRSELDSGKSHAAGVQSAAHLLRPELSWTHYHLLMRVDNEAARQYYMAETIAQNWSSRGHRHAFNDTYKQVPRDLQIK
ncbi:DUF1016 N-terminal domain-containing protein [Cnuella takakiae]|uniref:DUF1016 N-terminal domain-containing protein n=1 Tax=Cnuella takakiae TaxID=1302690 RepID=UPI0011605EEE|nr:DUF1016 N-terminal domain-containing protein [Cnuella takakiae]